jgi:hypothetical protein
MKPPSSNAESLRHQQAAQVRAANGLFVATDELRHLERGHQPIRQPVGRRRLCRRRSMSRFRVRRIRTEARAGAEAHRFEIGARRCSSSKSLQRSRGVSITYAGW